MDRADRGNQSEGPHLRIRLPRRQLRNDGHPGGRPRGGCKSREGRQVTPRLLLLLFATKLLFGQADLQGYWTNVTITPLERPPELAGKAVLTAEEAIKY